MALTKITKADFDAAIKRLTTSDETVWWKKLETTDDGTELCFVVGWNDGYDPDENLYQQDGYTLCSKIGYKHDNLMVMDYSDFYMPYDKKSGNVWDTDMSVGKGGPTKFDVKWYNDEAEQIWRKYGKPNRDGQTALDLMESKKKPEAKKSEKATVICSICGNPTDDPIWGEGNRAFCKVCYGDGDDFKHGKTKFVVGMMISLDGVKQYIRELKPRTFVGQSVDTGKEFSLPISSLNRASILYDPRNESKKKEAKKHACSMQKKIESLGKKNEAQGMNKIYHIKHLYTDVYEDSYEKGELECVNSWSGREVLGQKLYAGYDSIGNILRMLNDEYLYMWKDADNIKNWFIYEDDALTDEIRFDCDTLVDVENSPANDTDIENWKKGKTKLYNAHSVLYITAEYTTYASTDELMEEATKLGLDTI